MSAHTPAAPAPARRGEQPSTFGRPSPELLARAHRGYARFLAQTGDRDVEGAADNRESTPAACPSARTVLHDPYGRIEAGLPPGRDPHECLVTAVLAWTGPDTLAIRDYHQIALQLTAHARALAAELRHRTDQLPKDTGPRALADLVLRVTHTQLTLLPEGTARCAQNRARTVRALYERLDRLDALHPADGHVSGSGAERQ